MSALSIFYLVLPLPFAFIIHDAEEIAVQHRWITQHEIELKARFHWIGHVIDRLKRLSTTAFVIAALEELLIILAATANVLIDGFLSAEIWVAIFIAFSLHLIVHIIQALIVKAYTPGVVSSILLLPYAYYGLLSISLVKSPCEIAALGAMGVAFMIVNLLFAHWLGLKIKKTARHEAS